MEEIGDDNSGEGGRTSRKRIDGKGREKQRQGAEEMRRAGGREGMGSSVV